MNNSTTNGATRLAKYTSMFPGSQSVRRVDEVLKDVNAPIATTSPYVDVVRPTMSANAGYKLNVPMSNVAPQNTAFALYDTVGNQVENPPQGYAPFVPMKMSDSA
jgi:hypothetical protein